MPNMLLEKSGEIAPERMRDRAKAKTILVVDVTGDRRKVDAVKSNIA